METTEKQDIEQIIRRLGFADTQTFAKLQTDILVKNSGTEAIYEPLALILQFGFRDSDHFVKEKLIEYLKMQLNTCQNEIIFFEQKYKMSLEQLKMQFDMINDFDLLEKEMDEMEWEGEKRFFDLYQLLLTQLTNGRV
jgi:hypothetical protein